MAARTMSFWGPGPHVLYHDMGQDVIAAVYDQGSNEQVIGATIKCWWGSVEVILPVSNPNGYRVVVVG